MTYKILIVKNRYSGTLKIQKYLDWFSLNTPIAIECSTIETNFDVTTLQASNATYKGVICGADILPKLRAIIPEGKYNAVVFIYGNDLNGIRVSSCNIMGQDPLYPDTEFVQTFQGQDNGRVINHELFHAFFFKANKLQAGIEDPMDSYLRDSDFTIDAKIDTNREMALQRLAPHWEKICTFRQNAPQSPTVTITRLSDDGVQTLGELEINGFKCKTLEKPWVNNLPNISCVPKGTYRAKFTFSPKFLKYTYELQNVKNRTSIRLHSGNFFFDIQGCILLGDSYKDLNRDGKVDVQNSKITIQKFEGIMGKKDFLLVIK